MNIFSALTGLPKIYNLITSVIEIVSVAEKAYKDKQISLEDRNKIVEKIYPIRDNLISSVSNDVIQKLVDVIVSLLNASGLFIKS